MARKRVTKEEKHQRHEWAMKQIDKGVGFSELASLMAETWGCSRRNARDVVCAAHKDWLNSSWVKPFSDGVMRVSGSDRNRHRAICPVTSLGSINSHE